MPRTKAEPPASPVDGLPETDADGARGASVEEIADRILTAIWEHRLPPGTKLVEEKLGGVFGVSRTKVRLAFAKLAHEGVLTVHPNRGTFVSSPSVAEARQVLHSRHLLEPALVRDLAGAISAKGVRALRETTRQEAQARDSNDRRAIIRLSGEFHCKLAEMTGNQYLGKYMRELCSLTCLIIALYDAPGVPSCPHHEHDDIVDALEAGDGERAARLMSEHLGHVESTLRLELPAEEKVDLEAVFAAV
ncbi:GntR family transcriptional regulator [Cupriavidus sp. WGlv3]|uniref:GntR family transcriptional regulator n=1 Tax=Cupriavidus sp. WGlv3 TaxID=2919924 RepID=UPI00209157E8|nr:GntR family transcriptional regulator [Cupriavidus sp. WGlv3]MCO4861385.1 GntR family transcriptional regulator [Cupriavidus sp. WGlv3]